MRYRIESLIGIVGAKMAKYRSSWYEVIMSPFNIVWRPHLLGILVFEVFRLFKVFLQFRNTDNTIGNAFRFRYWD
jgi:hypothetical protein